MYHRRNYLRICKHRFSLFSFHLSLSRLWQRLIFSRLIVLIRNVLLYHSHKTIEIYFLRSETTTCNVIRFVTIVTDKYIDLIFEFEDLIYFAIDLSLIIIIIIHTRFDIDLSRLMREMLYTSWNRRKTFKEIKIFHYCLVRATI